MAVVAVITSLMQVIIYIADGLMVRALVLCSVSPFWLREDGLLAFIDLSMLHCHLRPTLGLYTRKRVVRALDR